MVSIGTGIRGILIPTVLCCICFFDVVSPTDDLDLAGVPDRPAGSLMEDLADVFKGMVRRRRQLPSRRDLDKMAVTEIEKQAFLAAHNGHRSTVDPTASNMIELRWDEGYGHYAQDWSANCQFQHSGNWNPGQSINLGENIFYTSGGTYSEKQAVDGWWNGYQYYTFDTKTCQSGQQCDPYITAAWAGSDFIGCGITHCDNLEGVGVAAYLFVCYYSGSFYNNTRPYQEGKPCSNCPSTYPRCRYNLCVTDDMLTGCEGYNGTTDYISVTRTNSVSDPMNCPGFVVDPIITSTESTPEATTDTLSTSQMSTDSTGQMGTDSTGQMSTDSTGQMSTDSSNSSNTTEADDSSCRVNVDSSLTLLLCLSSCFLILLTLSR